MTTPYTPEFAQTGVFQADGRPDMTVRLIADGRGIGMSMDYGDGAGPHVTQRFPPHQGPPGRPGAGPGGPTGRGC